VAFSEHGNEILCSIEDKEFLD